MNLEEWNLAINNASNIWIAGMMTIQSIFVIVTAALAYRQYSEYLNKKNRGFAISIKKLDSRLVDLQYQIFEKEKLSSFPSINEQLYANLNDDFKLVYMNTLIQLHNFGLNKRKIEKIQLKITDELTFLGENSLTRLFQHRAEKFSEIVNLIRRIHTQIETLNNTNNQDPNLKSQREKMIVDNYLLIKDKYGHQEEIITLPFFKVEKPKGLLFLDLQFRKELMQFY